MGDRKMKSALKNGGNTAREFPSGMRVLVVDGNQEILHLLETMLKQCNYEVTICNRGKDALKLRRNSKISSRFDIILTERRLPDIDEFKFFGALGKITDLPPVIVMSDDGDNSTVKKSILKYGACYYLVKPIQKEELKKMWIHAFKRRLSRCYEAPRETNKDKKERMVWTRELNSIFDKCYLELNRSGEATPKNILECMKEKGVQGLTRDQVASHRQKYHDKLRRINDAPLNTTPSNHLYLSTQQQRALAAGSISLGPNTGTQDCDIILEDVLASGDYSSLWNEEFPSVQQRALAAGSISLGPNTGTQNFQNIPSMSNVNTSLASPSQDCDIILEDVLAYGDYSSVWNEEFPRR